MLEAQLATFQEAALNSNTTSSEAFGKVQVLTEEKCQLQMKISEVERALSHVTEEKESLDAVVSEKTTDLSTLEAELHNTKSELIGAQEVIKNLEEAKATLETRSSLSSEEATTLQNALEEAKEKVTTPSSQTCTKSALTSHRHSGSLQSKAVF